MKPALLPLLPALALTFASAAPPPKPNIILILADDLGWGDVGFNGGQQARTPNLDRLAAEGLVLTDFHSNGAACTPTRAALMTGRYQQRSGMKNALFVGNKLQEGIGMAPQEVLIPERLREAGYRSALFGKWHLGGQPGAHPLAQGFDEFIGYLEGHMDYTTKWNRMWPDWNRGYEKFTEDGYLTHLLTNHTIEFITKKQTPFFIYLAHSCVHTPHMLPGDPPVYGGNKSEAAEHVQPEKYVRMITEMDTGIGEIVATLKKLGIEKNTLVLFTSDNGQIVDAAPVASAGPYRGGKGDMYEGGHRVPFLAWWPGTVRPGGKPVATAMTMDLFPTFLDLAGLSLPTDRPLDGTSLKPVLLQDGKLPDRTLFWDNGRGQAVRSSNMKLVRLLPRGSRTRTTELFDLAADPGETTDLSAQQPEKLREMERLLEAWMGDVAAGATPQPAYPKEDKPKARPKRTAAPTS
jgi:arylsulfatase A